MFLFFCLNPQAEEQVSSEKKSAYRYIIDNYFSKRSSNQVHYDYSRSFFLSSGLSFYRINTDKILDPYSSLLFAFSQNVKEIKNLGDLGLKVSLFSSRMQKKQATLLELMPFISIPEIQTAFPIYVGMGFGLGFNPDLLIKEKSFFSFNGQFFLGLRFLKIYHNLGFSTEVNLRIHYPMNELKTYLETLAQFNLIFQF